MNTKSVTRHINWQLHSLFLVTIFLFVNMVSGCATTPHSIATFKTLALEAALSDIAEKNPQMNVGVSVVRVADKENVYKRNEKVLFTPASTNKLVTVASALKYLGADYRFETTLHTDKFQKKAINNLYLVGKGDASFASHDLEKMVSQLKQQGVQEVKGDIVLDGSFFDSEKYHSGWMIGDLSEGYSAPISGLSLDGNNVVIGISPSEDVGEPARITVYPNSNFMKISSRVKTVEAVGKTVVKILEPMNAGLTLGGTLALEGTIPVGSNAVFSSVAISEPEAYAGHVLTQALKRNGIMFQGKTRIEKMPLNTQILASNSSKTLGELIFDIMKFSNNHATESLLKTMSANQGVPGSFSKGVELVQAFLSQEAGVRIEGARLADGSGLSRYNQLSPQMLTSLLSYMSENFKLGPEYIAALTRYEDVGGFYRAKSGSMSGIRNLAGYLESQGSKYTFCIMTSGSGKDPGLQVQVMKKITDALKKGVQEELD